MEIGEKSWMGDAKRRRVLKICCALEKRTNLMKKQINLEEEIFIKFIDKKDKENVKRT